MFGINAATIIASVKNEDAVGDWPIGPLPHESVRKAILSFWAGASCYAPISASVRALVVPAPIAKVNIAQECRNIHGCTMPEGGW